MALHSGQGGDLDGVRFSEHFPPTTCVHASRNWMHPKSLSLLITPYHSLHSLSLLITPYTSSTPPILSPPLINSITNVDAHLNFSSSGFPAMFPMYFNMVLAAVLKRSGSSPGAVEAFFIEVRIFRTLSMTAHLRK